MARNRFVQPDVVRLSLSDGDWIDVKRRLTYGEAQARIRSTYEMSEGRYVVALEKVDLADLVAYTLGWSLVDAGGKPVPFSEEAVKALDPASVRELTTALKAHIEAEEARRAQEKNDQDGASGSSAISPSAGSTTGPSTT